MYIYIIYIYNYNIYIYIYIIDIITVYIYNNIIIIYVNVDVSPHNTQTDSITYSSHQDIYHQMSHYQFFFLDDTSLQLVTPSLLNLVHKQNYS